MATRYAKFAPENEAAAEAFATFQNSALDLVGQGLTPFEARYAENFNAQCQAGRIQRDTNLNWVVAYAFDGPFLYAGNTIPAPSGIEAALELAVIVDTPDWFQID